MLHRIIEIVHSNSNVYNNLINTELLYEELENKITDFSSAIDIFESIKKFNCCINSHRFTFTAKYLRPHKIAKILRFMIDQQLLNRIKKYAEEMISEITDVNTGNENCSDIHYSIDKVNPRSLFKFIYCDNFDHLKYLSEEGLFDLIEENLNKILTQFDQFVAKAKENEKEKYFLVRTGYNRRNTRYLCLVKSFYDEEQFSTHFEYSSYYYQEFFDLFDALFDKIAIYLNIICQIKH
jgi:ssDNA-binding Zn-finger/Zn-ribbon topoisomerase 1